MMLIGAFYSLLRRFESIRLYCFGRSAFGVVVTQLILLNIGGQLSLSYTYTERKNLFGTYVLTIDPASPNYLHEKSPSGKNKMAWSELVRVDYGKGYVYIYLDLATALVIPEATLKTGDLKAFAKQVEKMIERFA